MEYFSTCFKRPDMIAWLQSQDSKNKDIVKKKTTDQYPSCIYTQNPQQMSANQIQWYIERIILHNHSYPRNTELVSNLENRHHSPCWQTKDVTPQGRLHDTEEIPDRSQHPLLAEFLLPIVQILLLKWSIHFSPQVLSFLKFGAAYLPCDLGSLTVSSKVINLQRVQLASGGVTVIYHGKSNVSFRSLYSQQNLKVIMTIFLSLIVIICSFSHLPGLLLFLMIVIQTFFY